jgi:hypothetical protein
MRLSSIPVKWILIFLCVLFLAVVVTTVTALIFFDQIKFDRYGGLASIVGLLVSVVGFGFTLWTVLETREINAKAQHEIREKVSQSEKQTRQLLTNIREKSLSDTCDATADEVAFRLTSSLGNIRISKLEEYDREQMDSYTVRSLCILNERGRVIEEFSPEGASEEMEFDKLYALALRSACNSDSILKESSTS